MPRLASLALVLAAAACSVPDKQPSSGQPDAGPDAWTPTGDLDTAITSAPAEFANAGTSVFEFTSNVATAEFECSVDGDDPVPCTSPFTRSLGDGNHTFAVRAVDGQGTSDPTPAEHVWTIDTIAPQTQLTRTPPATDNSVMVTFEFRATEQNVTFDCSLDNGAYTPCESGAAIGPLGDGSHSFAVRAHDRAGNIDASPAIYAWSIDTAMPDTQIISGPVGASASQTASFTFVSPDAGGGATFDCRVDGAPFAPCTSPHDLANLGEGAHTFAVRVRDAVGNVDPTPATRTWTVDLSAPETMIDSGPEGMVTVASASFTFSSTETNVTFACSLDGAPFAACTSPYSASGLAQGPHTFAVKAIDVAGHEDPTPATRSWEVDVSAPMIGITSGPAEASTIGPRVTFTFLVNEGATTCSLDGGPFAPCTSPYATNLSADAHQFRVRATDGAGNVATATRAFTVECAAPAPTEAVGLLHLDDVGQTLANAVEGGAPAVLGDTAEAEPADPAPTTGRFGGALAFTAAQGDHVTWPVMLGAVPALSFKLWARPVASGLGEVLSTGDGRVVLTSTAVSPTAVRFVFGVAAGNGQPRTASSAPVAASAWHHVVASMRDDGLRLWVDGTRVEAAVNVGAAAVVDAIRLGGGGATAYQGALDEVWVAQAALVDDDAALADYCPI